MTAPLGIRAEQVESQSTPGRAFSNGSEGDYFTGRWCDTCRHDSSGLHAGSADLFCPILTLALIGERTPGQWTGSGQETECSCYTVRTGERNARD
jgi:hypothetical protein